MDLRDELREMIDSATTLPPERWDELIDEFLDRARQAAFNDEMLAAYREAKLNGALSGQALSPVTKLTPEHWEKLKGIVIVDPDGWRRDGYFLWDNPITEEEFDRRAAESTIANRKEDGSW